MRCIGLGIILTAVLHASVLHAQHKVMLNPSDQDENSVSGGGVESEYALKNATLAKNQLAASGFNVRVDQDFYNAPSNANSWGAEIFVSIHSNAGGGHGIETLYKTTGGQTLAGKIQDGLVANLPYGDRGLKYRDNLHVLNSTTMAACLTEVVFHDCVSTSGYTGHPPSESSFLRSASGQQAIGTGIAEGVCTHFGSTCTGGPVTEKGFIMGAIYTNGDLSNRIAGTVSLNNGMSTTYGGVGVWSFEVDPGTYTVTASATGYQSNSSTVEVTAGQTAWSSLNLSPVAGQKAYLKGVIYTGGDTHNRIAGTVSLSNGMTQEYPGGSGVWSFEVTPGTYTVTATAPGYQANSVTREVSEGEIEWGSVDLTPLELEDAGVQTEDAGVLPVDAGSGEPDAGPPRAPPTPQPQSPVGGAVIDGNNVLLTWSRVVDPQGLMITYDLEVYRGTVQGNPLITMGAPQSGNVVVTATIPMKLDDGDYSWRVLARNPGAASTWSDPALFVVQSVSSSSSAIAPSSTTEASSTSLGTSSSSNPTSTTATSIAVVSSSTATSLALASSNLATHSSSAGGVNPTSSDTEEEPGDGSAVVGGCAETRVAVQPIPGALAWMMLVLGLVRWTRRSNR